MKVPPLPHALNGYEHIRRYWDHTHDSYVAKVLPGEYYVTQNNEIVSTVVGSCISACIRDSVRGIGGMNHFMLPTATENSRWDSTAVNAATRYGSYAMEHIINEILKFGGRREFLEVKLFGGGQIVAQMSNIGEQNIAFAKDYIIKEQLNLLAEDVGDIYPRKILYFPLTGRVRVKKLRTMEQGIISREDSYNRRLNSDIAHQKLIGEIDLF